MSNSNNASTQRHNNQGVAGPLCQKDRAHLLPRKQNGLALFHTHMGANLQTDTSWWFIFRRDFRAADPETTTHEQVNDMTPPWPHPSGHLCKPSAVVRSCWVRLCLCVFAFPFFFVLHACPTSFLYLHTLFYLFIFFVFFPQCIICNKAEIIQFGALLLVVHGMVLYLSVCRQNRGKKKKNKLYHY